MSFFGKEYVVDRSENFDSFLTALGLPDQQKQALSKARTTLKVLKDGDVYTLIDTMSPGRVNNITFKSGVEFEEKVRDHNSKSSITVDGNKVTYIQKFPEATMTYARVFSDDSMVETITTSRWDGKCTRYYKLA